MPPINTSPTLTSGASPKIPGLFGTPAPAAAGHRAAPPGSLSGRVKQAPSGGLRSGVAGKLLELVAFLRRQFSSAPPPVSRLQEPAAAPQATPAGPQHKRPGSRAIRTAIEAALECARSARPESRARAADHLRAAFRAAAQTAAAAEPEDAADQEVLACLRELAPAKIRALLPQIHSEDLARLARAAALSPVDARHLVAAVDAEIAGRPARLAREFQQQAALLIQHLHLHPDPGPTLPTALARLAAVRKALQDHCALHGLQAPDTAAVTPGDPAAIESLDDWAGEVIGLVASALKSGRIDGERLGPGPLLSLAAATRALGDATSVQEAIATHAERVMKAQRTTCRQHFAAVAAGLAGKTRPSALLRDLARLEQAASTLERTTKQAAVAFSPQTAASSAVETTASRMAQGTVEDLIGDCLESLPEAERAGLARAMGAAGNQALIAALRTGKDLAADAQDVQRVERFANMAGLLEQIRAKVGAAPGPESAAPQQAAEGKSSPSPQDPAAPIPTDPAATKSATSPGRGKPRAAAKPTQADTAKSPEADAAEPSPADAPKPGAGATQAAVATPQANAVQAAAATPQADAIQAATAKPLDATAAGIKPGPSPTASPPRGRSPGRPIPAHHSFAAQHLPEETRKALREVFGLSFPAEGLPVLRSGTFNAAQTQLVASTLEPPTDPQESDPVLLDDPPGPGFDAADAPPPRPPAFDFNDWDWPKDQQGRHRHLTQGDALLLQLCRGDEQLASQLAIHARQGMAASLLSVFGGPDSPLALADGTAVAVQRGEDSGTQVALTFSIGENGRPQVDFDYRLTGPMSFFDPHTEPGAQPPEQKRSLSAQSYVQAHLRAELRKDGTFALLEPPAYQADLEPDDRQPEALPDTTAAVEQRQI